MKLSAGYRSKNYARPTDRQRPHFPFQVNLAFSEWRHVIVIDLSATLGRGVNKVLDVVVEGHVDEHLKQTEQDA